jgi:membrane-associated protease RseP (regulator of RpoE activity)
MLGEPERTSYDLNFSFFGFPVRVHPLFWLVAVLLGARGADPPAILIWVVAMFAAIFVHELGHAVTMRAYGFYPWIVLYGMGGLASYDPSSGRGRRMSGWRNIAISFAGPLAGFLLAAAIVIALIASGNGERVEFDGLFGIQPVVRGLARVRVAQFLNDMLLMCFYWGLVNLLPIYPLDGGHIAREVFAMADPRRGLRGSLILSFVAATVMAAVGAVLWRSILTAVFFGYLAYGSYTMLQSMSGRDRW